jgi:hypothetical protein
MAATSMKKKAYAVAMVFQVILASTTILSKAAFDRGLSTFVFVFYRLAAASLFLLPLAILLARFTFKYLIFFFNFVIIQIMEQGCSLYQFSSILFSNRFLFLL